jgi:hypothetical protein
MLLIEREPLEHSGMERIDAWLQLPVDPYERFCASKQNAQGVAVDFRWTFRQ